MYPHTKGIGISVMKDEIKNPPDEKELRQRFKNFIMLIDGTREIITLNNYLAKHPEFIFKFNKLPEDRIIRGQIAHKGIANGRVRIIRLKNEINAIQQGEILVAPMTTPFYVPAVKIAAAIVTDEGGVTCHAAIVSRELGVPCVIGTKVATQVLKNGDEVEVDADNGIIKILNRSK